MTEILSKLNAELAEVKKHKGYDVVLKIKLEDGEMLRFDLGNGAWDVEPTEENGILTLRNNKEFADKSTSQTAEELTTTYTFVRSDLEVARIAAFWFEYKRDVVQKIESAKTE